MGFFPIQKKDVWLHAVSGGEIFLAKNLIERYANKTFLVTTMSDTGYEMAKKFFDQSSRVSYFYCPFDFRFAIRRLIKKLQPTHYLVVEHDLWPNTLSVLKQMNVKRILINHFVKNKDFENFLRFRFVIERLYDFDFVFAQNEETKDVLNSLFQNDFLVRQCGNLKYSNLFKKTIFSKSKLFFDNESTKQRRSIVCFGSSHEGEEELLANERAKEIKNGFFLIIPRHPDRAKKIKEMFIKTWSAREVGLISELFEDKKNVYANMKELFIKKKFLKVLVIDRMGLSLDFYSLSDVVLIGDTFIKSEGGHNFLEPLFFEKPVVYGMEMKSFSDITMLFEKEEAVFRVKREEVINKIKQLLSDDKMRTKAGKKGKVLLKKLSFDFEKLDEILSEEDFSSKKRGEVPFRNQ